MALKWHSSGTQSGTQDTQNDTEGDTQMIPKDKTMTSYKILSLPKTKLGEFTHHEQTPHWCTCIQQSGHYGQGH